ncbi:NF-kappa-B essential modulator-like isoform X5 [Sylvia atricapilla]|uniref:NF-kappa-B essential modulator-like isoform X5 n=1 Tax=Sylvia atricapilla TaxID=48155 RepID=UPI00339662E1
MTLTQPDGDAVTSLVSGGSRKWRPRRRSRRDPKNPRIRPKNPRIQPQTVPDSPGLPREPPMSGGRWRRPAEMVQPGPEAEPALAEALQRLRAENRELRGALCHCTESLRQRLEELRKLQLQRRGERELLRGRWGQARDLVLHLRGQRGDSTRESAEDTTDTPGDLRDSPGDTKDTPGDIRDSLRNSKDTTGDIRDTAEDTKDAQGNIRETLRDSLRDSGDISRDTSDTSTKDKAQVQAQVTSLLGELRESQNRLERSRAEREHLERRARSDAERCQQLEEMTQGHQVQLDQLRLQVTNLETALRVERRGATEEKRKLVQLQAAYHHLFQEYDAHIKASLEGDKRSQVTQEQLRAAEAALALKQELIDHLKAEAEQQRAALETIPVLQAQADIYRADFEAERAAREELHGQREALQEELNQLRLRLGPDGARARLEEMRNRHSEPAPAPGGFGGLPPPPEEGPDLCCPKCQYKAPDMDTLQIHVMDCIK